MELTLKITNESLQLLTFCWKIMNKECVTKESIPENYSFTSFITYLLARDIAEILMDPRAEKYLNNSKDFFNILQLNTEEGRMSFFHNIAKNLQIIEKRENA